MKIKLIALAAICAFSSAMAAEALALKNGFMAWSASNTAYQTTKTDKLVVEIKEKSKSLQIGATFGSIEPGKYTVEAMVTVTTDAKNLNVYSLVNRPPWKWLGGKKYQFTANTPVKVSFPITVKEKCPVRAPAMELRMLPVGTKVTISDVKIFKD